MAWPLRFGAKYQEFGGSFIYPMGEERVCWASSAGWTTATPPSASTTLCSSREATRSWHGSSPAASASLGRQDDPLGRLLGPAGRYWAPGMAIAGDGAGMVNIPTLKGVHYAMHAGMFAAEAIVERLKAGGEGTSDLSSYQAKVEGSEIEKDTRRSRNMRQPFSKGFFVGGAIANLMEISGGRIPGAGRPTTTRPSTSSSATATSTT